MEQKFETILAQTIDRHILLVTMNRPEVGNAKNTQMGIEMLGRAWSEARLLGLAYAFEQATRHRRAPRCVPWLG